MYVWKLSYLLKLTCKWSLSCREKTYPDPFFLTSQYFCVYKILYYCTLLGLLQKQITQNTKSKYVFRLFDVFHVKSFSFVKINSCKISKHLHLQKLVQVKIFWHEIKMWKTFYYFLILNSRNLVRKVNRQ